jgi:sulfate adenylyltransferase subunit 1
MNWYKGPTLMYLLENIHIANDQNLIDPRFAVQYIIRPYKEEFHDYRGYAGRVAGGIFNLNDKIVVLPSGLTSSIKSIDTFNGPIEKAFSPQSITIQLEDDIDVSRGDMIVKPENMPQVSQDIELMLCWLNEKPLVAGSKYLVRHTTNEVRCVVKEIVFKENLNTLEEDYNDKVINVNDIARVKIRTTKPLIYDSYRKNRTTGSLVLINEGTNETVGAGMVV